MRVGQNPAKSIEHIPQPQPVTVAVVSYIPFLSGYYAEGLDVLKACLESLWQNTPEGYDLLVFDNASCAEVRLYLTEAHQQGRIQYLVLSDKNVGKGGAWNFIFQGAPGEIVAYSDSDVAFAPGWLERSLELLRAFPRVGMVTSRPMRSHEKYYTSTLVWARETPGATLEQGQFQSWEVFKEHNDSLGVEEPLARQWFGESVDWRVTYHGLTAYVGAAHFQFVAPKAVLQTLTPFQMDRPMGQVRTLDEKLNADGYLRLCLTEPLVRHLGNSLAGQVASQNAASGRRPGLSRRLAYLPLVRGSLLWLYDRIFRIYFAK
jgi:glycosyltransferase involved in cell wall biosynthesis